MIQYLFTIGLNGTEVLGIFGNPYGLGGFDELGLRTLAIMSGISLRGENLKL